VALTRPLLVAAAVAAIALAGWAALRPARPGPRAPAPHERLRGPVAVLDLAGALGAEAAGGGALWMDDRDGVRLLRVDARTGRVRAAIPVSGRLAIAAGPKAVWAVEAGGDYGIGLRGPLLRIDPATGAVRARVSLGGVWAFGVLARGRDVWVWGPRDVLRVDARTDRVARRIGVGGAHGELRGVALLGGRLVVAAADGSLLRFDPRTGARVGTVATPLVAPMIRAAVGRRVVLSSRGAIAAVDPATGRIRWRRRLGFRVGAAVRARGLLWAHSAAGQDPGDRVTALDPATGRVRASMLVPVFGTTAMAVQGGRLWLATAGGRAVAVRLPGL
jgi:outer membrane protein assembly factor BamB